MAASGGKTGDAGGSKPLSRKLQKVLDSRLETDRDLLDSLKSLSTHFSENNLRTRRDLRSNLENRSVDVNISFLNAFKSIKDMVEEVRVDISAMDESCQGMMERLTETKEKTEGLIQQTTSLQANGADIVMKTHVCQAFLAKFQLTAEEKAALKVSGRGPSQLTPEFFESLAKVKKIHKDCKILLRTNHQTAGLEIMESMAVTQEAAYEMLYRWTQEECRLLTGDSPELGHCMLQAMAALVERPTLFKYTVDEFATARRATVVRVFLEALTRGDVSGVPRPIELHSHNPLRYVGDMLAWLHQTLAVEKELLLSLVKHCDQSEVRSNVEEATAHIVEGVCRPFKIRVEQVLLAEGDAVTLFKLTHLLTYYCQTVGDILGSRCSLLDTLQEMHTLCIQLFFSTLNSHSSKLLETVDLPPPDCSPSPVLLSTLALLKELFSCQSVMPSDDLSNTNERILVALVEPLANACSLSSTKLSMTEGSIYLVNCLHLIYTSLSIYDFADSKVETFKHQIDSKIEYLVGTQTTYILTQLGLAQLVSTVTAMQGRPMEVDQLATNVNLRITMSNLNRYLASPDSLCMKELSYLHSSTLRRNVKTRSEKAVTEVYASVYGELVRLQQAGGALADDLTIRTPEQVKTLLL